MALVGYARVSTGDQTLASQVDALREAGCDKVYEDVASGAKSERAGLDQALAAVADGDTLLVWRLDRLGRSLRHLVEVVSDLQERGVGFRSIQDGAIDTTTASGELIFHIFAALAQFERHLTLERTKAGLTAARARGRIGGRPKKSADHPKVVMAKRMHQDQTLAIDEICEALQVSRATYYRYLKM
ncbi:UNVERIFIED_CONTAM: hypothetical protein GTU68_036304 [Idotea baltica]|nr:hypothetical protein [Idotea baltica]